MSGPLAPLAFPVAGGGVVRVIGGMAFFDSVARARKTVENHASLRAKAERDGDAGAAAAHTRWIDAILAALRHELNAPPEVITRPSQIVAARMAAQQGAL